MIEDTQLAYIAGLLDGEGCIKTTGKGYLQIDIGNTYEDALQFVKSILGGYIYTIKAPMQVYQGAIIHRKVYYRWVLCGKGAAEVLALLLPYLIIKKEQAVLGIKLTETSNIKLRAGIDAKLRILKRS